MRSGAAEGIQLEEEIVEIEELGVDALDEVEHISAVIVNLIIVVVVVCCSI